MMRAFCDSDMSEINTWYIRQGREPIDLDMLPKAGLIVEGVAAGFLYFTDSCIAMLEGFVTNPDAASDVRHRALDSITSRLMEVAKARGSRVMTVIASDIGIIGRARGHGFKLIGQFVMLSKEIN